MRRGVSVLGGWSAIVLIGGYLLASVVAGEYAGWWVAFAVIPVWLIGMVILGVVWVFQPTLEEKCPEQWSCPRCGTPNGSAIYRCKACAEPRPSEQSVIAHSS